MESEIDLRPYIIAVLRRWRLILTCAVIIAALGSGLSTLGTKTRSASADVLIVPITSQVTLDPRFQTINGNQATTPAAQRQALISLASSQTVAERVGQELGITSSASTAGQLQSLLGRVSVSSSSDLLQITVSDPDPTRALAMAKAWGQAYEGLVAEVYTRSEFRTDLLTSEISDAQKRYDAAQAELETFVGEGKIIEVEDQVAQMSDLLTGSRQAQQLLYSDYLTRTRELDLILTDAQTLRDQANAQSSDSLAESLAALLLRARTVASAAPLIQLNAADLGASTASGSSSIASLDQLITVLARRREQIQAQASDLAKAIASGDATSAGLEATTRQLYVSQLADLKRSYEQLQARQDLLTQQRDLARDTLMLLQKKRDEQEVARSSPQIEVRFVSASLNPQPSSIGRAMLTGVAGGVIGFVLGIMLALLLDVIIPSTRRLVEAPSAQPAPRADGPADRPLSGD